MQERVTSVGVEGAGTIAKHTLADQIYDKIRAAIFGGEFKAGMELNQVEVAEHFGVSRVPVREALRRLQAEKLLSANPYQRYIVALLSPEQILELHDIRAELEAFAIRRTLAAPAEVRQRRVVEAMAVLRRMNHSLTVQQWLEMDRQFHVALNGREAAVSEVIEDLRDRGHRYLQLADVSKRRVKEVIAEHRELLGAIRDGDEEAALAALRGHMEHTRGVLLQQCGQLAGEEDLTSPASR
ncbi:GntR family transcriptional regulator [Burkholderia orbicola]|uniref:GntR family transcriptional regulator n=1 Tax=Burkholderia orbicola TaxID=2978683 RepID=UPI0039A72958